MDRLTLSLRKITLPKWTVRLFIRGDWRFLWLLLWTGSLSLPLFGRGTWWCLLSFLLRTFSLFSGFLKLRIRHHHKLGIHSLTSHHLRIINRRHIRLESRLKRIIRLLLWLFQLWLTVRVCKHFNNKMYLLLKLKDNLILKFNFGNLKI